MKTRKYEKFSLVLFLCLFVLFLEFIFILFLFDNKEYKYDQYTGVVVKDNLMTIIIPNEKRKVLYKNRYLYHNDKKIKYRIIEEKKNLYKNNGKQYHELLIDFRFDKKYKTSDVVTISIKKEKYRLIEMFKLIWDGD